MDTIYKKSNLYQYLKNALNDDDEATLQNTFVELLNERGFKKEDINDFLNDGYKEIEYNEENVAKYFDLVEFFQYPKESLEYIVHKYVIDCKFLGKIHQSSVSKCTRSDH